VRHYQHFGLEGPIFRITSPSQSLYMSQAHCEAFAALEWGLCYEPSGFTLLIGEPGTGKTTLLLSLLARDRYQIRTALLSNPKLCFDELLREVLRQFGIGAGPSKLEMIDALDSFLGAVEPGGRVVIIVDEAQTLSDEALEEMRLLSNRGASEEKRLHFIVVGQRELARRLLEPGLHQLNDRIGARAVLDRMSRAEAFGYVEYCLRIGGGTAGRVFGRRALARVVDHSGGLPRRLNVLCHNAMLAAYSAGRRKVNLAAARTAVAEYATFSASVSSFDRASLGRKRRWLRTVAQEPTRIIRSAKPSAGAHADPLAVAPTEI
jgi:type II secretory pathway predicted ATPase ExeA